MSSTSTNLNRGFLVWGLAASFYLFGFFHRVTPGVLTEELTQAFNLSRAGLGNLSAWYFYCYAAMQIPVGLLVDRVGPRKILTIGCLISGVGALIFGMATSPALASLGRGLIGGSVAVAWVSMLMLIASWFSPSRFASMSGLSLATGTMGAVLAGVPLKLATDLLGWRTVMTASGAVALALALLIWVIVRNKPPTHKKDDLVPPEELEEGAIPLGQALLRVFRIPAVWLVFWIPSGVCGAFLTFTGLWGVPYLVTQYGLAIKEASSVVTGMLIAFALGSLAFGWLSDHLKQRKLPFLLGGLLALQGFAWLYIALPQSLILTTLILWACGFGSGSMVLSFGYVRESVPSTLGGTSVGVVNLGVMVGPLVQQPLLGWILDRHAQAEGLVQGYSLEGMSSCMGVLALWVLTSLVALSLTRETHARPRYD